MENDHFENEYIYFDYEKYLTALKSLDKENFGDLLKEAVSDTGTFMSQKIIFEFLKKAKGLYYRHKVIQRFNGTALYFTKRDGIYMGINNPEDSELTEEQKLEIIQYISDLETFKIYFKLIKLKNPGGLLTSFTCRKCLQKIDIPLWLADNIEPHYVDGRHFFESVSPMYQKFFLKYFKDFKYPDLDEKSITEKLEDSIVERNVFMVNFWIEKHKNFSGKIQVNLNGYGETSFDSYKTAETLINNGYIEKGNWVRGVTPTDYRGSIFASLFEKYYQKNNDEKLFKTLEDITKGREIEMISFLVQKIKK